MTASWHTLTPEALLSELCSNIATGLAESETRQRLQAYGPNELPEAPLFRERPRLLFTARNILTRLTPATTLPARPESAKTASSPKDTPCPRRAQFHRARSASKGIVPAIPPLTS
jgi:Cation transporter/ATPase, N-terminus